MTAILNVVGHPLIQHKLTLMRERDRSIKNFRELTNEIGMLLCYEVTRDLPLEMVDIETPLTPMKAPMIAGKKLTFAPILRAGVGFLDGMLALFRRRASPISGSIAIPRRCRRSNITSRRRRICLIVL